MKIGLTGPKGVGKSTTAHAACDLLHDTIVLSFAEPVYQIAEILSGVDRQRLSQKNIPFETHETIPSFIGKTPRWLLQMIGTEMVRNILGKNVWVELMSQKIERFKANNVFIDDCRFDNEASILDVLIKLKRQGIEYTNEHQTEQEIDADVTIDVTGTPEEAAESILEIISEKL